MSKAKWVEAKGYHVLLKVITRKWRRPILDTETGVTVKIKINNETGELKLYKAKGKGI